MGWFRSLVRFGWFRWWHAEDDISAYGDDLKSFSIYKRGGRKYQIFVKCRISQKMNRSKAGRITPFVSK